MSTPYVIIFSWQLKGNCTFEMFLLTANRQQQKTHNSHDAQQTAPQSGMEKVPENR